MNTDVANKYRMYKCRSQKTADNSTTGWRSFLRVSGSSALFCLSAISIMYGIAQMITPVMAQSNSLSKTLPCIGALNLYELALRRSQFLISGWWINTQHQKQS